MTNSRQSNEPPRLNSVAEFFAQALAIEVEATERYGLLATDKVGIDLSFPRPRSVLAHVPKCKASVAHIFSGWPRFSRHLGRPNTWCYGKSIGHSRLLLKS